MASTHGVTTQEWKCYSPKMGWSMRLKLKARNIIHFGPHAGGFTAAIIFGDRAVAAAHAGAVPATVLPYIDAGTKYPEGTGVRIPVRRASDVAVLMALAALKLKF